jgi:hypothetical protein
LIGKCAKGTKASEDVNPDAEKETVPTETARVKLRLRRSWRVMVVTMGGGADYQLRLDLPKYLPPDPSFREK